MNFYHLTRLIFATLLPILLSTACANKYTYNDNFLNEGPVFVKVAEPVPEPIPEPTPEPEMSVAAQNSAAISAFEEIGFEAEETDKGVVVYLPPTIYFEGSKSDIGLDARSKIAEIAKEVNKEYLQEREIEVSGHTDTSGPEDINLALSKKRAEAAASELVFSKVRVTRMFTRWYGESAPRAPELNEDGSVNTENQKLNRRVEFVILNPHQNDST